MVVNSTFSKILAIPIPIHPAKYIIANTNTNTNFKEGLQYQYQYFFGIAETIPVLCPLCF